MAEILAIQPIARSVERRRQASTALRIFGSFAHRCKRPVGYFRPDDLLHQTAVHVQLHFDHPVPGPITLGAGLHCGFGLFAASGIP
jgi:CRISPR-associated protein Csb2